MYPPILNGSSIMDRSTFSFPQFLLLPVLTANSQAQVDCGHCESLHAQPLAITLVILLHLPVEHHFYLLTGFGYKAAILYILNWEQAPLIQGDLLLSIHAQYFTVRVYNEALDLHLEKNKNLEFQKLEYHQNLQ